MPTCYRHPGRETYIRCQRCSRPICPDCMRDASVGFQCPSCVAEGAKATRSGRTAYGGLRSGNPGLTSLVIIGVNAVVWLGLLVTGGGSSALFSRIALLPTGRCASTADPDSYYPGIGERALCLANPDGSWIPGVADGAVWQLLTSAFTHLQPWHIGFNMLALWFLGPQLEMALGRARFVAFYLLSALAGSVSVYWLADPDSATLGASGAVFGLMGGLLLLAVKVGGDVRGVLVWVGLNAVFTVTFPNISWQGHLGGFLGGALLAAILIYAPRTRRTWWQVSGLAAVAVVLVALVVARTLTLVG